MQTERQMAANPQSKPTDLACESAGELLPSTSTVASYYYYSTQIKVIHFTVARTMESQVDLIIAVRVCSPCPRLYIAVAVRSEIRTWVLTHHTLSLDHCKLQRHMGVNNLPTVVTSQRGGRKSNSQPSICESNAPTTRLQSHVPQQQEERDDWKDGKKEIQRE